MAKSNSNQVREAVKKFILDSIDIEALEEFSNKLGHRAGVLDVFKHEFENPYNCKCYPNRQNRFFEWAMGAPSILNMSTCYDELIHILIHDFKTNTPAKIDPEKSARFFYYLIYTELLRMEQEPHKMSERMLNKISKTFK